MDAETKALLYALGDGDKIRDRVEYYLFSENFEGLSKFSKSLIEAINSISAIAFSSMNVEVIMAGGDDVLFQITKDKYSLESLLQLAEIFKSSTGNSFSFGIGSTITSAYLNLRKAKSLGGGCVIEEGAIYE